MSFREEIEAAINRCSQENGSNTPDFILSDYLATCLLAFDTAVNRREVWCGRRPGWRAPFPEYPMEFKPPTPDELASEKARFIGKPFAPT